MTYAYFPERQHTSRSKKTNKPPYYSEPSNGIHEFPLKRSAKFPAPSLRRVWFEVATVQFFGTTLLPQRKVLKPKQARDHLKT